MSRDGAREHTSNVVNMAAPPPPLGLELASPPTDGVTSVRFSDDSGLLLATSWDAGVRLYDADPVNETSTLRQHFTVRDGRLACFPLPHCARRLAFFSGDDSSRRASSSA